MMVTTSSNGKFKLISGTAQEVIDEFSEVWAIIYMSFDGGTAYALLYQTE